MKYLCFVFGLLWFSYFQKVSGEIFLQDTWTSEQNDTDGENVTYCDDLPGIYNGEVVFLDPLNISVGAIAQVLCYPGWKAVVDTLVCSENGLWENWENFAECVPIDCGPTTTLENGLVTLQDKDNSTYGALADVTCSQGYQAQSSVVRCLATGIWENVTCEIIDCGPTPTLQNGLIVLQDSDNTTYGTSANVTCSHGYQTQSSTIMCLSTGVWENATCELMDCGPTPTLENGLVTLQDKDNSTYGALADVTCSQGYQAQSSFVRCLTTGIWENVTCEITDCGATPTLQNGLIVLQDSDNTTYGTSANVTCSHGYQTQSSAIMCLSTGVWENATCELIDCGPTPTLENGLVTLQDKDNSTFGALGDVTCSQGYQAQSSVVRCLATGIWENVTCEIIDCGATPTLQNGLIVLQDSDNTTYGTSANVTCSHGYQTQSSAIMCLSTGVWENATCELIDCGPTTTLENGLVTLQDKDNSTYGALADVTCSQGYQAQSSVVRCLPTSIWENVTCEITDCGATPTLQNGLIVLQDSDNTTYGTSANVTCSHGYQTQSSAIMCLSTGVWENATCELIDCDELPGIYNGEVVFLDPQNISVGAIAQVLCNPGWKAVVDTLVCSENGLWENWENFAECVPIDCGPTPTLENGLVTLQDKDNSTYGALADVTCSQGYQAQSSVVRCLPTSIWENVTCEITDCGATPTLQNGRIVLQDSDNTTYGTSANVTCSHGYQTQSSAITCLSTGVWENATCELIDSGCRIADLPSVSNGIVTSDDDFADMSWRANVSCDVGYAPTSPRINCLGNNIWNIYPSCQPYDLGIVRVESGQSKANGQHTAYLRCRFKIVEGLTYRVTWYFQGSPVHETQLMTAAESSSYTLPDDMFTNLVGSYLSSGLFGSKIKCGATVYDGLGEKDYGNGTSDDFIPVDVSAREITMMRGKQTILTVFLNIPFGCPDTSKECFLRFVLYDPYDYGSCYRSTIAAIHSNTCGGRIDATSATTSHYVTNITVASKNNRWYWSRGYFYLKLQLSAEGNTKLIWNLPSTTIVVRVTENYHVWYAGCYSFVDPYMYTFDRRYYSMQLLDNFVFMRHKTLPIEIQTVTAPCNGGRATCSCAVTVRAGGDVFTINHCGGHLVDYLSAKDRILRVYRWWANYYQIVLPTGMEVYVYIMYYFDYMMNVYAIATPSDFEEMEGLCGNFNGNMGDDTILRGTNTPSEVESSRHWYWWYWWSSYFFPHDFAYSWGLENTEKQSESLLNPDVYRNVERWDTDKKFCVCPLARFGDYSAICSADEEASCTWRYWRWGTLVEPSSSRARRDIDGDRQESLEIERNVDKRLQKMRYKWKRSIEDHSRQKREIDNSTAITLEDARDLCEDTLNSCNAFSKKDDLEEVAESDDTLTNCARDVAIDGNTTWVQAHCDAYTTKVTVQVDKDEEFASNHSEIVEDIKANSCPGNCSGHGQCINKTCICEQEFGTDLCLINVTKPPDLTEIGDDGICDISDGSTCDNILVVGDGFVEDVSCSVTVLVAETDGKFHEVYNFSRPCVYLNFNEIFVPVLNGSSSRRRRETNDAMTFARMVRFSVSNNGLNYGDAQTVVVLDTTCQQNTVDAHNDTIVTLKSGFCYISGICYQEGTLLSGSACSKCVTSENLFAWTNDCESTPRLIIIICSTVGGAVLIVIVGVSVAYIWKKKQKRKRPIQPITNTRFGHSKALLWIQEPLQVDENNVEDADIKGVEGAARHSGKRMTPVSSMTE